MNKNYVVIEADLNTKRFDKQIEEVEYRLHEIDYELSHAKELNLDKRSIQELETEAEKLTNQLVRLNKQQDDLTKHDFSGIGEGIENITKKVGRWALAVFGVRSAYSFVRSAINTIAGDNEQLAADIDNMKRALAYTIEPIVRTIVNLAKTLMSYIAYIVKAWTGRDIFASANKSLKSANKSAKELQKTSASFDKFNKLGGSNSSGGGASVSGLKPLGEGEVPKWLKWIADNKDKVTSGLIAIAAGLAGVKLGLTGIQGLGLGVALYGIMETILNIINFLKDPTFENFIDILGSIAIAVGGVATAFGAWPVAVGAAIAWVFAQLLKHYDDVVGVFDKLLNWLENDFTNTLRFLFGPLGDIIAMPFIMAVSVIKSAFESLFGGIKKVVTGIIKIFKGDFKSGIKDVFGGLKDILLAPLNAFRSAINVVIKGINKISFDVPDWVPGIGGKKWGFNIPTLPKLAKSGIINMPGKGFDYHGANIGERGAEWVQSLTDEESLTRVGTAIGKHVKVNVDFVAEIEGRVLARVMQEINAENRFARNGG